MVLHIGQYGNVLRTLHLDVLRMSYLNVLSAPVEDVLRTSVGDFHWHYIENSMGTSIRRLLGIFKMSSGRPRDVIHRVGYKWKIYLVLFPCEKGNEAFRNKSNEYVFLLGCRKFILHDINKELLL